MSANKFSLARRGSKNSEKGVSLVVSFFIMIIIIAIVLAITALLYNEIRLIRNIGNSVVAFYAADSGIEKVLYYDRKVIPAGAARGLCSMVGFNATTNATACPSREDNSSINSALNCNRANGAEYLTAHKPEDPQGCDPATCTNCTIRFATNWTNPLISNSAKDYAVTAKIENGELTVDSLGTYNNLARQVELFGAITTSQDFISIIGAYADPLSSQVSGCETGIGVYVEVTSRNVISSVEAYIKTSYNEDWEDVEAAGRKIILTLIPGSGSLNEGTFFKDWCGPEGSYYVDAIATDEAGYFSVVENIQPFFFPY